MNKLSTLFDPEVDFVAAWHPPCLLLVACVSSANTHLAHSKGNNTFQTRSLPCYVGERQFAPPLTFMGDTSLRLHRDSGVSAV